MSYRLQQSLSERPCVTRNAPSKRSEPTPPFSFSTTIHRYGETGCDFVDRRRRVTVHLEGVRYYGYRYYNPDLGRWINRDPLAEPSFATVYQVPKNRNLALLKKIESIIEDIEQILPELAIQARSLLMSTITSLKMCPDTEVYLICNNNCVSENDILGLMASRGPGDGDNDDEDEDEDCCDQEAADKLIDETISNLLGVMKDLPGKAGKLSKLVGLLKAAKGTSEACGAMDAVSKTCVAFAENPTQAGCLQCCNQIYGSFGNQMGGIGYFVCHRICKDFQ